MSRQGVALLAYAKAWTYLNLGGQDVGVTDRLFESACAQATNAIAAASDLPQSRTGRRSFPSRENSEYEDIPNEVAAYRLYSTLQLRSTILSAAEHGHTLLFYNRQ